MLYIINTHENPEEILIYMINFSADIFILHSWYLRAITSSKGSGVADLWKTFQNTKNIFKFTQDYLFKISKFQLEFQYLTNEN